MTHVRLGSKYTFDVQAFENKTEQNFVSSQNELLANSLL